MHGDKYWKITAIVVGISIEIAPRKLTFSLQGCVATMTDQSFWTPIRMTWELWEWTRSNPDQILNRHLWTRRIAESLCSILASEQHSLPNVSLGSNSWPPELNQPWGSWWDLCSWGMSLCNVLSKYIDGWLSPWSHSGVLDLPMTSVKPRRRGCLDLCFVFFAIRRWKWSHWTAPPNGLW